MRTVYVYDRTAGHMVDKVTRAPMVSGAFRPVAPATRGDIAPYVSPADGVTIVSGKRAARDDMRKHGCIDTRELGASGTLGGKFANPRFAAKRGLPFSEEAAERLAARREARHDVTLSAAGQDALKRAYQNAGV